MPRDQAIRISLPGSWISERDIRNPGVWLWNHVRRGMIGILALAIETRLFLARTIGPLFVVGAADGDSGDRWARVITVM